MWVFIGPGAKKTLDIDHTLHHTFTTLRGIGDEAYVEPGYIFWRRGDTWFEINLVRLDLSNYQTATLLEQAARTAAARTP